MPDYQAILDEIRDEVRPLLSQGHVADYIPRLACVPREKFGMAVVTLDGRLYQTGDAAEAFSIQSISKVYTLTLALQSLGDSLWQRVGREPSGNAFNSLVQLELENGLPRNPFINAGALVVADVVLATREDPRAQLLTTIRGCSGNPDIRDDPEVALSEKANGFRNAALANFIRSFGNLEHAIGAVLDFYFFQCSLAMSCVDLARGFLFLANRGRCPWSGADILSTDQAKRINALMLTCGTYDAAGDFAYHVGIPGKSGVGGGIVGVIPNQLAVAVWSPALNAKGNSLAGSAALERFTAKTGLSIF
ncbi:glutaminase [Rhodanobacter sp. B04]|uniref:glutaminase n=1 Tax=Rhodanobacter sp. B04 TaxID=1945860 RepID=UPI000984FD10|nr:glutaminase [Rhodanobacter sp. B04]OOG66185.1 glutaminase [Rhodanobacter sp. B04]